MSKPLDEEIIKQAVKDFIKSNPDLVKSWIAEVLTEKPAPTPSGTGIFKEKFDREKVIREHAIKWETIDKLQKLWADAPPADELVKLLTP